MTQEEAKNQIFPIWRNLPKEEKYGPHCGFELHNWLLNNRPDLLSFRFSGDKYQLINCWVIEWQRYHPKY